MLKTYIIVTNISIMFDMFNLECLGRTSEFLQIVRWQGFEMTWSPCWTTFLTKLKFYHFVPAGHAEPPRVQMSLRTLFVPTYHVQRFRTQMSLLTINFPVFPSFTLWHCPFLNVPAAPKMPPMFPKWPWWPQNGPDDPKMPLRTPKCLC